MILPVRNCLARVLLVFATIEVFIVPSAAFANDSAATSAEAIVQEAIHYWRDTTSRSRAEMVIHREDWERTSELVVWTRGSKESLVRFISPAKDAGNASLTIGDEVWSYTPKINRIIKIPPSMKAQSWMGSDFSYQDLSKADDIIHQYHHRVLETRMEEGHKVSVVESIPLDSAPVVWGKEVLHIRDDHIIVEHDFYDQDMKLVKRLQALEIKPIGGKLYATRMRMTKIESKDEWTEVLTKEAEFGLTLPNSIFTQASLSNTRIER